MKLSIGIVGLPNVGKSTLFKLLTKQEVHIANYPFTTIDPNVGIVSVPDERLDKLAATVKTPKKIPAVVEFYDIAGLVKGANKGEGLGNQFLSHIRECQAIVIVLRAFQDPEVAHVEGSVDPVRDIAIITNELIAKDLGTVEKQLAKAEADGRSGSKEAVQLRDALMTVRNWLNENKLLANSEEVNFLIRANKKIEELNLLTAKKQLFLLNGKESEVSGNLRSAIRDLRADHIVADLVNREEPPADLITKAYKMLNLITFFTFNETETRAWTVEAGTKAPQAAGVIHTDFERNFIRAEVINWQRLLEAGGWHQAKQKGLLRLEGKEYVVKDGDVMLVRHG
jgi:GTP-binding protein YchF